MSITHPPGDHHAPKFLLVLGRAGLAARGLVYLTIGVLAAMTGLGLAQGKILDQSAAIREIGSSPFGLALLGTLAVGLGSYVFWRFGQVIFGTAQEGHGFHRIRKRGAALASGLAYVGLSTSAFTHALGQREPGSSAQKKGAAILMAQPLGDWLVGGVGLALAGVAIFQFWRAVTAGFAAHVPWTGLSPTQMRWTSRAGRAGYFARGVAFSLIAWFFLRAAFHHDVRKVGGLKAALETIGAQPTGPVLLVIVGAGLALFGVYSLLEARYRQIS